ncbi:glycosyltransferase [Arthrobacter agilis]|uniref:glycosyltransferase n=1 Tax=Arthrobacter agilis TaxID=37921 RepID=UPI002783494B|nr:glycosyltransferase [Arthrobacter agilis]MDQ0734046.1 glycosyltransferase involved in cell wall biosynthesis [Arthrobacter agilis]
MRILQIVTLITPDGAYGGPVRVAINQSRALVEAGHDVEVVAGALGFNGDMPAIFMEFPVRLFAAQTVVPRAGFAGLTSAPLLLWLTMNVRHFDVVHIHLARDFVTLPSAAIVRAARIPYIVQTHGMIDASNHLLAGPLDTVLTKPVLKRATQVLYLTDREAADLTELTNGRLALRYLPNGVPSTAGRVQGNSSLEVLFLARLHKRKRPLQFVEMAIALHKAFPDVQFRLVGPDEGEAKSVQEAIAKANLGDAILWEGALDPVHTLDRMSQADLYVLPSVDEPFPMSVLEALSLGLPVVVGRSCGLAERVRANGCGTVFDESLNGLTEAVAEYLADQGKRNSAGIRAQQIVKQCFSMNAVADELQVAYEMLVVGRSRSWHGWAKWPRRIEEGSTD